MYARPGRIERELRTIEAMIGLFCRDLHGSGSGLCQECGVLRAYAHERLVRCPFGASKPTCANCTVHCYHGERRERVRSVMRYAGPRMLLRHPVLTLLHLYWDSRRAEPSPPMRRRPA